MKLLALAAAALPLVAAVNLSPVTRVAELLTNLSKQVEAAAKADSKLYIKYNCWFKETKKQVAEAKDRADARIAVLDVELNNMRATGDTADANAHAEGSGASEHDLTSERSDLTKQLDAIKDQIEKLEAIEKQRKEDYEAAKAELEAGEGALAKAITTMTEATKGSFLARKFDVRKALLAGKKALGETQYEALEQELEAQPKKDWDQINKEGDFKNKYEKRSGGIQDTLANLLSTFQTNLKDANDTNDRKTTEYDQLHKAKSEEKKNTEDALNNLESENAARELRRQELQAEHDQLSLQTSTDASMLTNVTTEHGAKTSAYENRKLIRSDEVRAISNAIYILRSDDNRDLFKKSFESQTSFFQLRASKSATQRATAQVWSTLRKAGHEQKYRLQLTRLRNGRAAPSRKAAPGPKGGRDRSAMKEGDAKHEGEAANNSSMEDINAAAANGDDAQNGAIQLVIDNVNNIITDLDAEEKEDLQKKDDCTAKFEANLQSQKDFGINIDAHQDAINTAEENMARYKEEISQAENEIQEDKLAKLKARHVRNAENEEWASNDKNDKAAIVVVEEASTALKQFYTSASFLQQPSYDGNSQFAKEVDFGNDADGFGAEGQKEEGGSVVAALKMISDDIQKDITKAKEEEDASQKSYDDFVSETDAAISANEGEITRLEGEISTQEGVKTDNAEGKQADQKQLGLDQEEHANHKDSCNYWMRNFETRRDQRNTEKDGLQKAKTILKGAHGA